MMNVLLEYCRLFSIDFKSNFTTHLDFAAKLTMYQYEPEFHTNGNCAAR